MSLFLGKVNGNPLLHITNGQVSPAAIKTTSVLPQTAFNSNFTYPTLRVVGRLDPYYYDISDSSSRNILLSYRATSQFIIDQIRDPNVIIFFVALNVDNVFRDINLSSKPGAEYQTHFQYVYNDVNGSSDWWDGSVARSELYYESGGKVQFDHRSKKVTDGRVLVYAIDFKTDGLGGSIKVGKGAVQVGNFDVFKNQFLNLGKVNNYDFNIYLPDKGIYYQILNNYYGTSSGSGPTGDKVYLKHNSIYVKYTTANVSYPLFGGGLSTTTTILSDTTLTNFQHMPIAETNPGSLFLCVITEDGKFYLKFAFNITNSNLAYNFDAICGYSAPDKEIHSYNGGHSNYNTIASARVIELGKAS